MNSDCKSQLFVVIEQLLLSFILLSGYGTLPLKKEGSVHNATLIIRWKTLSTPIVDRVYQNVYKLDVVDAVPENVNLFHSL